MVLGFYIIGLLIPIGKAWTKLATTGCFAIDQILQLTAIAYLISIVFQIIPHSHSNSRLDGTEFLAAIVIDGAHWVEN